MKLSEVKVGDLISTAKDDVFVYKITDINNKKNSVKIQCLTIKEWHNWNKFGKYWIFATESQIANVIAKKLKG